MVLLSTVPLVAAEPVHASPDANLGSGEEKGQKKELKISFEEQYHSQWLSKGGQAYGKQGAFFEIIDLDFFGSGFGAQVIHRHAIGSGYTDKERYDYRPYYRNQMFKDKPYAMKYDIGVEYEHYPNLSRHKANTTYEWRFAFSWPNILPKGFVPGYIAYYEYPAYSGDRYNYITGWVHVFKLDYNMDVPELLPNPLCLSSEVAYNDGLNGYAHDWSYATFGLGSKFNITKNLIFTPGLYHQITMDESVSQQHNITYCILTMRYNF